MAYRSAQIFIRTDQAAYLSGDRVTGTIYLLAPNGLQLTSIVLNIRAFETARFEEETTHWEGDKHITKTIVHTGDHILREDDLVLYSFPLSSNLPPSPQYYAFPFSYQLPENIPSSHSWSGTHFGRPASGNVAYELKATIQIPSLFFDHQINSVQRLIVHQRIREFVVPAQESAERNIRLCCCVPKGIVNMKAWFEKNMFTPGDDVRVFVEINNTSTVDIPSCQISLVKNVRLSSNEGKRIDITEVVATSQFDGAVQGATVQKPIVLHLPETIEPSSDGTCMRASYYVHIKSNVPWSTDVHIKLPTTIYGQVPQTWGTIQPVAANMLNPLPTCTAGADLTADLADSLNSMMGAAAMAMGAAVAVTPNVNMEVSVNTNNAEMVHANNAAAEAAAAAAAAAAMTAGMAGAMAGAMGGMDVTFSGTTTHTHTSTNNGVSMEVNFDI
ncbi:hypothetical protein PCE1_001324 [Barthelona sp. PCE]